MKKRLLLVLFFMIFVISGCSKAEKFEGSITSFEYTTGSYDSGVVFYNISKDDDKYLFTAEGVNGISLEVNKELSNDDIKTLENVINESKIIEWNGFDKSDGDVLDGHSFSITITYSDNKNFYAHGYMKYPEDYEERIKKLDTLMEEFCK